MDYLQISYVRLENGVCRAHDIPFLLEVSKPLLCFADYDDITTALSGFLTVPKAGLVYSGCCKAPLVLCWETSHELSAYSTSVATGISGHQLLLESGVTGVAIGDRVCKCPTLKVSGFGLKQWSKFVSHSQFSCHHCQHPLHVLQSLVLNNADPSKCV